MRPLRVDVHALRCPRIHHLPGPRPHLLLRPRLLRRRLRVQQGDQEGRCAGAPRSRHEARSRASSTPPSPLPNRPVAATSSALFPWATVPDLRLQPRTSSLSLDQPLTRSGPTFGQSVCTPPTATRGTRSASACSELACAVGATRGLEHRRRAHSSCQNRSTHPPPLSGCTRKRVTTK